MAVVKVLLSCFAVVVLFLFPVCSYSQQYNDRAATPEEFLFEPIPVVTSASGREQNLKHVAQSMTVITSEDIRRWGATCFADLFIHVPGMQTRNDIGYNCNLSVRSDPNFFTNDLLVLLDGAIVFNPAYSGTYWNTVPIALDEIDRIEIIRGPGGVLYSSNAVSGVVNIISKSAAESSSYAEMRAGTLHMGQTSTGVKLYSENDLAVRGAYAYDTVNGYPEQYSGNVKTYIHRNVASVRADYNIAEQAALSVFAHYNSNVDKSIRNVGGLFDHHGSQGVYGLNYTNKFSDIYDLRIHADAVEHVSSVFVSNDLRVRSYDAQIQNNFNLDFAGLHIFSFGTELFRNELNSSESVFYDPYLTQSVLSFFLNEEYRPSRQWILTLGTRADKNSNLPAHYDSWIYSPRFSAVYLASEKHKFKISATKSYRTPSFIERNARVNVLSIIYAVGSNDVEPEKVLSYEAGYSGYYLNDKFNFDIQFFYHRVNDYLNARNMTVPAYTLEYGNLGTLKTWGSEISGEYFLSDDFSLYADASIINGTYKFNESVNYFLSEALYRIADLQLGAGARYTLGRWKFDLYAKYVSGVMESENAASGAVGEKLNGFYKFYARTAYLFSLLDKGSHDAEIELVLRDIINKNDYEETNKYFREPLIYCGLRVDF